MITHAPARPAPLRRPAARGAAMRTPAADGQAALARALNRAPAVAQLAARGAALSAARAPVQRVIGRKHTVPLGLAAGGLLGGYWGGGWGAFSGALLGGSLGLVAPGLVRRGLSSGFVPERVRHAAFWQEIDQEGSDARTIHTPGSLADSLAEQSEAFRKLRGRARDQVRTAHDRELSYESKTGGYAGAYGEGRVRIDTDQHPAVALGNVVFETANAAQSVFFEQVRKDEESGAIDRRPLSYYATLLGRDADEMEPVRADYETGDAITRRVLLQEWGEYNSLQLARGALGDIGGRLRGETATDAWEKALWKDLLKEETFGGYYELRGVEHRRPVEASLRRLRKKEL